ncbi:MAG: DNA polymerase III subunit beta [Candidatus Omnitrophica bacterium]|nr:DNA polymerase III subunit beta [Candidatus Omnitrophota bacterium]
MKFIINRDTLLETLQKALGPTTTKQNLPVLNDILITTSNEKLKLVTTDLDITTISLLKPKIIEEGKITVPMKRFLAIIRELPSNEVTVQTLKNNLLIKCEKIEFKMNTSDPNEFPKVEEENHTSFIKINPQELEEMIKLTSFCVGQDDVNYVLGGVLFDIFENTIKLIATDGKRLSFIEKKLPATQSPIKTKISFILPIKAVTEIQKLIKDKTDEILLFTEENRVGFDFKGTQFIARPIEGEFPNYAQYIPDENREKMKIDKKEFLLSLRRAAILSTPDYQGVKLDVKKDSMVISKQTPQMGEVKEVVSVKYGGAPLQIGFNPSYLLDVLKNLSGEEVDIEFFGADKPAILRKENYIYLALPIKI